MSKLSVEKKFSYKLLIRGTGGLFTMDQISTSQAEYWLKNFDISPLEDVTNYDGTRVGSRELRYHFLDHEGPANLVDEFGFSDIDKVTLYLEDSENVIFGWYDGLNIMDTPLENQSKIDSFSGNALTILPSDSGSITYEFTTSTKFDYRKLRFTRVRFNDISVVNKVIYDDVEIERTDFFEKFGEMEPTIVTV